MHSHSSFHGKSNFEKISLKFSGALFFFSGTTKFESGATGNELAILSGMGCFIKWTCILCLGQYPAHSNSICTTNQPRISEASYTKRPIGIFFI
jgi:hypothetical protein